MRVELVDAPGALAAATSALAALGVDVGAIEVLEVDGRTVVDEFLLRLPRGTAAHEVEDALRMAGAVDVLSSAAARSAQDPVVGAFRLVGHVLAAHEDTDAPGRALARCAYADVGALVDLADAERYPLALRALASGVPTTARAGPEASPLALATGWVLWVAPQVPEPKQLGVVGWRLNVRFSATEAARLRAFLTLLEEADRQRAPARGSS